jgi:hypothetical protein
MVRSSHRFPAGPSLFSLFNLPIGVTLSLLLLGTALGSIKRPASCLSLPVGQHKQLIIKYESKVLIANKYLELLLDQFRMAIHNQRLGLALDHQWLTNLPHCAMPANAT